uniref:NADH-ubiquinone oxidoreductase chain 4L n=1 Tax=Mecinus janthinus TaxID=1071889 RepID=A0A343C4Y3_9CUCU|nr:NADH dehydrogenase subunit 4L [Mecinus janthinus]
MFMYFSGFVVYIIKYQHFLLMLLSLESTVLSLYMMLFIYFSYYYSEFFLSMLFLSMSVCEAALGLSLLILLVRTHSNDMIMTFDSLW